MGNNVPELREEPILNRCYPAWSSSNNHAIHSEDALLWLEFRNRFRLDQRNAFPPEVFELVLIARAIEVEQVSLVGGGLVGKPLVHVRDADLVEQLQAIARSLTFISQNVRKKFFIDGRLVLATQVKRALIHVPLHGVAKKVSQQEQAQFGRDGVIHLNLSAVEVASQ